MLILEYYGHHTGLICCSFDYHLETKQTNLLVKGPVVRSFTVFFVHHTKKSNLVQNKKFCGFQTQGCDYSLVHNFLMVIYPTNLIQIKTDNFIFTSICCSFDCPPRDDHISKVGFLKMTTF